MIFITPFLNWDSLHARLTSHYKAQGYKKKEEEKDDKYMGKLLRGNRSFQPSTAFDRETRHFADQMTDLCMKCNSGLKSDKISLFILEW